jgi:phenylpropionate dioxygenase-like ring-hydroxylating dioxygenase large terminal subunit
MQATLPTTPQNPAPNLLAGAPWLIAHKSMLNPNQPMKISLLGQDYVLWQDAAGRVQALPNACPHMGAMLSAGWCEDGKVVCPFHALAFDGAGCTVLPGSGKQTQSLLQPLELIIQGDFIWSYGGAAAKLPIPTILMDYAQEYEFIGSIGDVSIQTDLLSMLLNMHDYNHQNGTHRSMFRVEEVNFQTFVDEGLHSHAYYNMPRSQPTLSEMFSNPAVLAIPKVIQAHLENIFPCLVIFHGESAIGSVKQIHVFVPESATHTRTYVLMYGQARSPIFRLVKQNFLALAGTVIEQDAAILAKIYRDAPQNIKLNNEVGMDWVRRNFASFPDVSSPNLSRDYAHPATS